MNCRCVTCHVVKQDMNVAAVNESADTPNRRNISDICICRQIVNQTERLQMEKKLGVFSDVNHWNAGWYDTDIYGGNQWYLLLTSTARTVDELHETRQGTLRHLLVWIENTLSEIPDRGEKNARSQIYNDMFAIVPTFVGLKRFRTGILGTKSTMLTAAEFKSIMKILVPIIKNTFFGHRHFKRIYDCVRFLVSAYTVYMLPSHTDKTIEEANSYLQGFNRSKEVFLYIFFFSCSNLHC